MAYMNARACEACGLIVPLEARICPRCDADLQRAEAARAPIGEKPPPPIDCPFEDCGGKSPAGSVRCVLCGRSLAPAVIRGLHFPWGFVPVRDELVVGRNPDVAPEVAAHIQTRSVSRIHARLWIDGSRLLLEDLGSKYGTWVDGVFVPEGRSVELGSGSVVQFSRQLTAFAEWQTP